MCTRRWICDEETLKQIADVTGGAYFRAQDTAGLEKIYEQIDQMERTEAKVKEYMEYEELFARFAFPGLLLILAEIRAGQHTFQEDPVRAR